MINIIKNQINNNKMNEAFIMVYFYDQVLIGRYENQDIIIKDDFDESIVNEIHIFNEDKEIRWKRVCNNKLDWGVEDNNFILIKDTEDYFEESMFLIGNKSRREGQFTTISQYGRKMILPFEYDIQGGNHTLALIAHHLFNNDGSIGGYRLVNIKEVKNNGK